MKHILKSEHTNTGYLIIYWDDEKDCILYHKVPHRNITYNGEKAEA